MSKNIVLLVGSGDVSEADLACWSSRADKIVAADGGANLLTLNKYSIDCVIGDLDSITNDVKAVISPDKIMFIDNQDNTDLEKCLERIEAKVIVGLGFFGDRLDHNLANQSILVRYASKAVILLDRVDMMFVCPPKLWLDVPKHTNVSFYPLGPLQASSKGLQWSLTGLNLCPIKQISTSNKAMGAIEVTSGNNQLLTIMPKTHIHQVVAQYLSGHFKTWEC
ncbi:MAG: thiamine diphosphokinase [Gammaproteobacteria bacterium]|nr:thiamine diphosphokinase [Gammaproteobacteria bacterium]